MEWSGTALPEPFAEDRLDRAGLKQAFGGGLLGEVVRNRDLDGSHDRLFRSHTK